MGNVVQSYKIEIIESGKRFTKIRTENGEEWVDNMFLTFDAVLEDPEYLNQLLADYCVHEETVRELGIDG